VAYRLQKASNMPTRHALAITLLLLGVMAHSVTLAAPVISKQHHLSWRRAQLRRVRVKAERKTFKTKFSCLRRIVELARDPAHGNRMTSSSKQEAIVGIALEAAGKLPGPIVREQSGKSEFVDANGQRWDVKAFTSKYPKRKGGFVLGKAVEKLKREFAVGENVILDTRDLDVADQRALQREISKNGWNNRVLWYPPEGLGTLLPAMH
jgi:hypothetical protein